MHDEGLGVRWKGGIRQLTLDELNPLQSGTEPRHVESFDVRPTPDRREVEQVRRAALYGTQTTQPTDDTAYLCSMQSKNELTSLISARRQIIESAYYIILSQFIHE